jgi:integrase
MSADMANVAVVKGSVRRPRSPGGEWSYRLDRGLEPDGRRRQKQVGGFRTKKDAQAALNEALAGVQRGSYVTPSRQTVGEFLERWIEGARSELAVTAWTNYRDVIGLYVTPYLGTRRLVDLSPIDIKAWHAGLLEHGRKDGTPLATRTVQLAHRVLRRALNDAVRWSLVPTNPASAARAPKIEAREMTVWTAEEAARFLRAVADDRLGALWAVALHTGLRRGELAGLRWVDVDLRNGTLTVAQQRTTASYKVIVSAPKAKSHRQLLLAPQTVSALDKHRKSQRVERVAGGPAWHDTGYVFVDELGEPYHPQLLRHLFEQAARYAGAPIIRLHDLRHTMATLALQAGVHPKVVQEQLGHSGIDVTLDVYSHVPQAVRRDSASKIAELYEVT